MASSYTVAYPIPGHIWKRKTIRTGTAAEQRFYDMIEDEAAEIRWND